MIVKGKVAIVTGASGGIGLSTAKLLTKKGVKVALVSRSFEKLKKISQNLPNSLPVRCDMSDAKDIKRMVKKVNRYYQGIDILVNNAGRGYDSTVESVKLKILRKIIDLDFVGPLYAMKKVIPIMRNGGGGVIVNISSGTALRYIPGISPYASVKNALSHMSLTAREELKDDDITVCVVYPFITDTAFEKHTIHGRVSEPSHANKSKFKLPSADSPEYAAGLILEAITKQKGEVFAHGWMKKEKA